MTITILELANRIGITPADALDATIATDCGPWFYEGETFIDPVYLRTRIKLEVYDVTMLCGLCFDVTPEKVRRLAAWLEVDAGDVWPETKARAA